MSDTTYGLPTARDSDGGLKPVEHAYSYNGQDVTIELIPPTVAQMDDYESMGDDISFADLYEIVDKHVTKPDLPGTDQTTAPELLCYLHGIMEVGTVGGSDMAQDVHDALQDREGSPGN